MLSSPRTPQLVVVAHHTALQLHAQHPLHKHVSCDSLDPIASEHASKTHVSFLSVRPSSTSCSLSWVPARRQAARAYRAHRDSMPSRPCLDSIWRRRSVGKERGRWFCRGVVSMSKVGSSAKLRAAANAAVPSTTSLAALFNASMDCKQDSLHGCTTDKHLWHSQRTRQFYLNIQICRHEPLFTLWITSNPHECHLPLKLKPHTSQFVACSWRGSFISNCSLCSNRNNQNPSLTSTIQTGSGQGDSFTCYVFPPAKQT